MNTYTRHLRPISIVMVAVGLALFVQAAMADFPTWLTAIIVGSTLWHALLVIRPQILTTRAQAPEHDDSDAG
jgi:hypothetical protein